MKSSHRKNQSPDGLIDYIRESLVENAEPYAPGAWENFNNRNSSKRSAAFWKRILSSAAALLLIGNGIYLLYQLSGNKAPVEISKTKHYNAPVYPLPGKEGSEKLNAWVVDNMIRSLPPKLNNTVPTNLITAIVTTTLSTELSSKGVPDTLGANGIILNVPTLLGASELPEVNANSQKLVHLEIPKNDIVDFLKNEMIRTASQDAPLPIAEIKDKWGFEVALVPGYGAGNKLSLGYSLKMLYALSERVSLTSGIGYNKLGGAKEYEQPQSSILLDLKVLESSRDSYTGIDLPLGVSYNLSKSVYANVGVSAFAVIEQSRYNHFRESKLVERTVRTASGQEERRTFIDNVRTIEEVHDSQIDKAKYLAMYNLSLGYKQRILKTMNITVEPFIKVPVTRSNTEGMRNLATGVRLSADL